GRPERHFLACLYLDRFSGCGIAPHASCALPNLQDAETRNTDSFTLLEMLGDKADQIAQESFTCPFRQLMLFGQRCGEMLECNGTSGLERCHEITPLQRREMRSRRKDMIRDQRKVGLALLASAVRNSVLEPQAGATTKEG